MGVMQSCLHPHGLFIPLSCCSEDLGLSLFPLSFAVAVQTFLKLCLRTSKDTAAALALVSRNEWALKTNKIMVEVQPVNRKSARKLSKPRLSFFLLLSGVGEVDKVTENHFFSRLVSTPFSASCSMAWEKSAARGESFGNT
ncbi:hypothetical protein GW17_00046530 [Ensete ventricosum]|nr:hypothetical protein GW17_00046530 [Ensete ventricosum]